MTIIKILSAVQVVHWSRERSRQRRGSSSVFSTSSGMRAGRMTKSCRKSELNTYLHYMQYLLSQAQSWKPTAPKHIGAKVGQVLPLLWEAMRIATLSVIVFSTQVHIAKSPEHHSFVVSWQKEIYINIVDTVRPKGLKMRNNGWRHFIKAYFLLFCILQLY